MMYLNKQIKELYDVSDEDYRKWCDKNDKSIYSKDTMSAFIYRLRTGRLVKDENGRLITKKPRKK